MDKILAFWEKKNKYEHSKNFHEKNNVSLFYLLVDGILKKEALAVVSNLSRLMAENLRNPFQM